MKLLLPLAALLGSAGAAHGGNLGDRYVQGLLYSTPHEIVYRTQSSTTVFFQSSNRIQAYAADPVRGLYAVSTASENESVFYLFDIRGLYGSVLSRKSIVTGKGALRFEEVTLSPDGRYLRRKDGSLDNYEISYYDVANRQPLPAPPPESVWMDGPWSRETFGSIAYRRPGNSETLYSVRLSTEVSDIRLFPSRDEALLLFYGSRPPALYSLNPFQERWVYPATAVAELARSRPIDWCPGGECLLLKGEKGAYLFFPKIRMRQQVPYIPRPCDDLRSRHAAGEALLIECRDGGRLTSVLSVADTAAGSVSFAKLPLPETASAHYHWKEPGARPWLIADLNTLLKNTRRAKAEREAKEALAAKHLALLRGIAEQRLREEREKEERRRRTDPLVGKTAALLHVGILGALALRLRLKG